MAAAHLPIALLLPLLTISLVLPAQPREQTSCLMELIRRMEEDANRKIEILIDTDVGQQAQIVRQRRNVTTCSLAD